MSLGAVRVASAKVLTVWATVGDLEATATHSNTFALEWPPRSGRMQEFPEIDRVAWFGLDEARARLLKGQLPFLDRLRDDVLGGWGYPFLWRSSPGR